MIMIMIIMIIIVVITIFSNALLQLFNVLTPFFYESCVCDPDK